jgi:ABC-type nickel/cobalt efflux system permease component RcnA
MFQLLATIAIGFVLGIRHATDPDHVIAVSTITSREQSVTKAALIGVVWGIGHTLTIMAVGTAMILFRIAMPERVGLVLELAVAIMLVVLGVSNLRATWPQAQIRTRNDEDAPLYHAHGDYVHAHGHAHSHPHPHDPDHTPVTTFDRRMNSFRGYRLLRPLIVGIVHGLAGSAAVALLVLSTIPSVEWSVIYLAVFGVGTIMGMMVITIAMASTLRYGQSLFGRNGRQLQVACGVISIVFGVFLGYQIGFVDGLFASRLH